MIPLRAAWPLLLTLAAAPGAAQVGDTHPHQPNDGALELSEPTMELLREEMRALLTAVQTLPAAIAIGDWETVVHTGAEVRASYILDQQLTEEQAAELQRAPEHFKRLDAQFHREAAKLEEAASHHDAQLASFHYYRLLEACTACHSLYAPARFPGLAPPEHEVGHTHGH